MNAERLVADLDKLDHRERLVALIAHARRLSPNDREALARALFAGDTHRRLLALEVSRLVPGSSLAWEALRDPSRSVRCAAAVLVGRGAAAIPVTGEAVVVRLLDEVDTEAFAVVRRRLLRRGGTAMAEALVAGLVARDRLAEAGSLLAVCSTEEIQRWLERVAWFDAIWLRLARHRPELMVELISRRFVANAERPAVVWQQFSHPTWDALAQRVPETLAAWIDRWADADSLSWNVRSALRHLARWSPAWVVRALGTRIAWAVQSGLPIGLARRIREVDDATLAPLAIGLAREAPHLLAQLLARSCHAQRARVFELAIAPLETALREWPVSLLAVLPTPLRDREAARMRGLTRAQTDASWRRSLLGLRAIEHARPALEQESRSAQAPDRAEALAELVRSSYRARAGMPETLTWLRRLRNEQDPVRLAALTALAEAPGSRFTDAGALDEVVAPIFDARDTSWGTRAQATQLAHKLLIAHATTPGSSMFRLGVSILERLAGQAGTPHLPDLSANLPRGAEQAIASALLPWVEAASKRQQEGHLLSLWRALGKRAWNVPALGALLEQVLWKGSKVSAHTCAELWLEDPKTRDARVLELVSRDRSALYVTTVLEHAHARRQTLLAERFSTSAPRGRFHDGKVVVLPTVDRGFQRWPTELQRRYTALLEYAEGEPKRFSQSRAALIALRARVPVTTAQELAEELASTEVPIQEAALGALVWLDVTAPALPILLEHLDGDRARVAMYAMPRLARLTARDAFVQALAELLARPRLKITVHKEALRLLGQLATARAVALLAETWQQPLHRDVRIAALHAARALLSQEQAWTVLASVARDPDVDLARALVEVPSFTIAEAHRARYVATMASIADHPSPVARAALFTALTGGWWSAAPLPSVELATRVLGRGDLADPWRLAAQLVAEGARAQDAHPAILRVVVELAGAADRDVAPAGERDRLAHQRLLDVLGRLSAQRHPVVASLLEALAAALLASPTWWEEGARARLAAADNARLAVVCVELLRDAPTPRMRHAVEELAATEAATSARSWSPEEAAGALAELRAASAGRAAARMLAGFGPRWGWGAEWQRALAELREDPDLDARLAARSVWISAA